MASEGEGYYSGEHFMLPGTHEWPRTPECKCGSDWDYWGDQCAKVARAEVMAPMASEPSLIVCAARGGSLWMWCPGCDALHSVSFTGWDVDTSDLDRPTVSPSILVIGGPDNGRCHSFLVAGNWMFLADSTHALAGQTVAMVPLPLWFVNQDDKEES